jgi:hypothetical protein
LTASEWENLLLGSFFYVRGVVLGKTKKIDLRIQDSHNFGKNKGLDVRPQKPNSYENYSQAERDAKKVRKLIKLCEDRDIAYEKVLPTASEAPQPIDFEYLCNLAIDSDEDDSDSDTSDSGDDSRSDDSDTSESDDSTSNSDGAD